MVEDITKSAIEENKNGPVVDIKINSLYMDRRLINDTSVIALPPVEFPSPVDYTGPNIRKLAPKIGVQPNEADGEDDDRACLERAAIFNRIGTLHEEVVKIARIVEPTNRKRGHRSQRFNLLLDATVKDTLKGESSHAQLKDAANYLGEGERHKSKEIAERAIMRGLLRKIARE